VSALPNFFIAGAPKAATTSLYHYLDQHPQVYMSAIKEPHYFAAEIREENIQPELRRHMAQELHSVRDFVSGPMREKRFGGIVANWEDYLRLFANANGRPVIGEASVCYLWSPSAAERIAAKIPQAKIVVMLRDPADRAFSQYLHGVTNGAIRWDFREHIRRSQRHNGGSFSVYYPFLEFGLYAGQLERYRNLFGENVFVGLYEDFRSRPLDLVHRLLHFLVLNPEFSPDMSRQHLEEQVPRSALLGWLKRAGYWRAAARLAPAALRPIIRRKLIRRPGESRIAAADRRYLIDFYRADVLKLECLLGRDLTAWITP
jgi:hypothetical protein